MNDQQQRLYNLAKYWLPMILAALPALIPLKLIIRDGVDMPNADQWGTSFADMYVKAHRGELSFWDFTSQHNEHRIFFPKVAFYLLNNVTGWNTKGEMVLAWLLACGTSAAILFLCLKTKTRGSGALLWFLCNLLIFTPMQWENLIWGLGVINLMPMFWITAALVVSCSKLDEHVKLLLAGLFSFAATFSSGNGVLAWIIVTPVLFWSSSLQELRQKRWLLAVWGTVILITAVMYAFGYKRPEQPPGAQVHSAGIVAMFDYLMLFLINPFPLPGSEITYLTFATCIIPLMLLMLAGITGYGIFVWSKYRDVELARHLVVWLVVAAYAVLSGMIAAWFRSPSGVEGAMASRYVSYGIYLPVALINLVPIVCADVARRFPSRWERFFIQAPAFLGCAILLASLLGFFGGFQISRSIGITRRQGKAALLLLNFMPDNPRLVSDVFGFPRDIIQKANELSDAGYLRPKLYRTANALELRAPTPPTIQTGQLEQVAQNGDHINVTGWAILPGKEKAADAVVLSYENESKQPIVFAMAEIGAKRPEVANTFGNSGYLRSGWFADFPISALPASPKLTRITAWAVDTDTGYLYQLAGDIPVQR
ncbi:MAG TPA: hypothetical protein VHD56_04340 [Tepidisphaeraceae bacterium]|nr:hypothetical protein [Tepidisphaeraceae bacterium]